jgi:uncharacterized protein YegP (UPF0339 family)
MVTLKSSAVLTLKNSDMKIKINQAKNKQFYFIVIAKNNKTLLTSETYTTKRNCLKTATSPAFRAFGITKIIDDTK